MQTSCLKFSGQKLQKHMPDTSEHAHHAPFRLFSHEGTIRTLAPIHRNYRSIMDETCFRISRHIVRNLTFYSLSREMEYVSEMKACRREVLGQCCQCNASPANVACTLLACGKCTRTEAKAAIVCNTNRFIVTVAHNTCDTHDWSENFFLKQTMPKHGVSF